MEDYKAKFEKLIQRIDNSIANGLIDEKAGRAILKDFTVESEDEMIRKAILELVKQSSNILNPMNQKSMIDWIEKQGEHANFRNKIQIGDNVTRNEDGVIVNLSQLQRVAKPANKQGEQKPADKVEPKFKIEKDKWYICIKDLNDDYDTRAFCKGRTYHSTKDETLMPDNSNIPFEIKYYVNDYFRLWTIQDAKDGDVLYLQHDGKEHIIIYKGVIKERFRTFVSAYCAYNGFVHDFCFADVSTYACITSERDEKEICPATKEQRDLLFQKMKEAGYVWDADKKELKKIGCETKR